MKQGNLYLIPTYLSVSNDLNFIAPSVAELIKKTDYFLVENVRTARRFISSLKTGVVIDNLRFEVLDKKTSWDDLYSLFDSVREGKDIGLMSEAGLPCLADPGNKAVSFAHQTNIRVVSLPGTSSIQMALVASGFNGQLFTFNGYIPIDRNKRIKKIKELEKASSSGHTQLFMETPYRNMPLVKDILKTCRDDTLLSIAADISGSTEFVRTMPIRNWKKSDIQIHKIPTIFSFGQFP